MKKVFVSLLAVAMLAGCNSATAATPAASTTAETPAASAATTESTGTIKIGVGSASSISTKDAAADAEGQVQVNTTFCGVTLEGDVIKAIYFDVAQNAGKFDATGVVSTVADDAHPTKKEKGDDYGMKAASGLGKEWYEQAAGLEEFAIGKTVAEFEGLDAENADLKSSVTIGVDDFLASFSKAVENAIEVTGTVASVGVGSATSMSFKDAAADAAGKVQSNVTYAIVALDADGKVLAAQDDVAQQSAGFTAEGIADTDVTAAPTKMEKGEDYGMKAASGLGKEWFEQNEGFEAWTVGKTAAELASATAEDADLLTTTTIGIDDLQAAVVQACETAKTLG